jgi:hypothetical protein
MQHTYKHSFQNGTQVTLVIEATDETLALYCEPPEIPMECEAEYLIWRDQVVNPDIFNLLTPEQARAVAKHGAKTLNGLDKPKKKIQREKN